MICLPSDLNKLCKSYLDQNELIYYFDNWNKFSPKNIGTIAAEYGWIDLLDWIVQTQYVRKKVLKTHTICANAIVNGHLDFLKVAYNYGCKIDKYVYDQTVDYQQLDILKWLHENNISKKFIVAKRKVIKHNVIKHNVIKQKK